MYWVFTVRYCKSIWKVKLALVCDIQLCPFSKIFLFVYKSPKYLLNAVLHFCLLSRPKGTHLTFWLYNFKDISK